MGTLQISAIEQESGKDVSFQVSLQQHSQAAAHKVSTQRIAALLPEVQLRRLLGVPPAKAPPPYNDEHRDHNGDGDFEIVALPGVAAEHTAAPNAKRARSETQTAAAAAQQMRITRSAATQGASRRTAPRLPQQQQGLPHGSQHASSRAHSDEPQPAEHCAGDAALLAMWLRAQAPVSMSEHALVDSMQACLHFGAFSLLELIPLYLAPWFKQPRLFTPVKVRHLTVAITLRHTETHLPQSMLGSCAQYMPHLDPAALHVSQLQRLQAVFCNLSCKPPVHSYLVGAKVARWQPASNDVTRDECNSDCESLTLTLLRDMTVLRARNHYGTSCGILN